MHPRIGHGMEQATEIGGANAPKEDSMACTGGTWDPEVLELEETRS